MLYQPRAKITKQADFKCFHFPVEKFFTGERRSSVFNPSLVLGRPLYCNSGFSKEAEQEVCVLNFGPSRMQERWGPEEGQYQSSGNPAPAISDSSEATPWIPNF